jgi:hypothetical protein
MTIHKQTKSLNKQMGNQSYGWNLNCYNGYINYYGNTMSNLSFKTLVMNVHKLLNGELKITTFTKCHSSIQHQLQVIIIRKL